MSNPNPTQITFTPASGEVVTLLPTPYPPGGSFPIATQSLPAADGSNLDILLTSNSGAPITISFAGGGVTVPPGATMMLTSNQATLAGNQNPLAQSMSALGSSAVTAQVWQVSNSGTLTFQRGTAVMRPVF